MANIFRKSNISSKYDKLSMPQARARRREQQQEERREEGQAQNGQ